MSIDNKVFNLPHSRSGHSPFKKLTFFKKLNHTWAQSWKPLDDFQPIPKCHDFGRALILKGTLYRPCISVLPRRFFFFSRTFAIQCRSDSLPELLNSALCLFFDACHPHRTVWTHCTIFLIKNLISAYICIYLIHAYSFVNLNKVTCRWS